MFQIPTARCNKLSHLEFSEILLIGLYLRSEISGM